MNQNDFSFGTRIIENFDQIPFPEIRQIHIETTSVISEILQRNPEVSFSGWFSISDVVMEARKLFEKHLEKGEQSSETKW